MAGTVVPFLLVGYLAMREGGYDAIVRSEVGITVWWTILIAALIGLLPATRPGRVGWLMLGVLGALAIWTGLGMLWSESAERSATELSRVASLLGVFALALTIQGPAFLRRVVGAVGAAVAVIAGVALASRFHPDWFPANEVVEVLPTEQARLNYPLTYWNGLAVLVAIGVPLLLWGASSARTLTGRGLAVAALPALALTLFFTISRGGALATGVTVAVLLLLHPKRLRLLPPMLLGAAGGALLIIAANRRSELTDGLLSPTALDQGNEMTVITIGVCVLVGLAGVAIAAAGRRRETPASPIRPRTAWLASAAVLAAAAVAAIAVGAPAELGERWDEFKDPTTPGDDAARFAAASGSGRYQWWEAAVDASGSEPLAGIGPGTFEFWWARDDGTDLGFVRDAHSLYLEMLAELGVVGFVLILALVGGILGFGAVRTLRGREDTERTALLAAATAGAAGFAVAAAIDWAWEMTVLSVAFLLLGAAILVRDPTGNEAVRGSELRAIVPRLSLAVMAIAAMVAIALPTLSTSAIRASQDQVNEGELSDALASARRADDLLPFAATPNLQEALVLELAGELDEAAAAADQATRDEPTNWRTWLVLSRIEAERGKVAASTRAYREARALNPRSPLFSE